MARTWWSRWRRVALLAPVNFAVADRLSAAGWALAASSFGRAALALVMAAHFDELLLYPAALGVLVLKAHNVLRAAVVPRPAVGADAHVGQRAAVGFRPGHVRRGRRPRGGVAFPRSCG